MKKLFFCLLLTILLTGCFKQPWTRTLDAEYNAPSHKVSLRLPADWMLSSREDVTLVTRDGVLLQNILVATIGIEDELKYTKKKFRRGMSPLEQAEIILDNMAGSPNRTAFKIKSKKPAKIGGHQAFRSEFTFKDQEGLLYRGILYGFMQNNWFYAIRYLAPQRHYFQRDKKTFDNIVKSVKLII